MSTHFSVSIHCLLLLAEGAPERMTSSLIASSINTNPVVVRRIMSRLKQAGLVDSSPGARGFRLRMSSSNINLKMIYEATKDEGPLFAIHTDSNHNCEVGRNIDALLDGLYTVAEQKIQAFFETITLRDLEQALQQRVGQQSSSV
ncbi:Rrf2 family transcriptional regulator [Paenibacillus sp. FSL R7-0340]|uniref:Rrf2 family transcriptional regulator n=1 Tax=Paenibacillus sp. FSL R7-0340 TaxID=2921684 RepID=UPI0030F86505